jgi:hypothetical protein
MRNWLVAGLIGILAGLGTAGCSSPSMQARACSTKTQMQASLDELRATELTDQNASHMAVVLTSLRHGLKTVEGAVHLPQQTRLQQLGGVGRLRQLESNIDGLVQALNGSGAHGQSLAVPTLQGEITERAAEVQQITDAIVGC